MRIAFVGNFEPQYSTENDLRKAMEHLGHEVRQLQEDKATWQQVRQESLSSDMLLWVGTWDNAQPYKETVDTLRQCGIKGIPTVTIHLDIFFGSDRGDRKWWLSPMFQTAYVFTADGDHDKEWRDIGVNHYWLKPAVRHDATHFGNYRQEYACDVAFVGSGGIGYHTGAWPYRKTLVDFLRTMCQRNGWVFRNPGGELNKPNAGKIDRNDDMNDFYASAKVTVGDSLCLFREKTRYCSDRVYEATGRGGFLIMPKLDFLKEDFGDSLPMYEWGDFAGLEEKVRFYIENKEANDSTRQATCSITSRLGTYVNRFEEVIKTLEKEGAL